MTVLELRNIYKTYNQGEYAVPVLKDVSLKVEEGDFLAIMGPSGSGKSTLMNIIGCLDRQSSGEYYFDGESVQEKSDNDLADLRNRSIGFVFQNFNLLPRESARENVELPLVYAGINPKERRERAEKALRDVGLEDRMEFNPTQLSGGQKQRVAVARAMINNPRILLADEPTGALDTKSGEQLMRLFTELNSNGMTIVMITHEPEVAQYAAKTVIIRDGVLLDSGREDYSDGL